MLVIIAEDDMELRRFLKEVAEEAGHEVRVFENGAGALDFLKENPPGADSLLIVDCKMPVMDGEQLLASLAAEKISLPTVAISGYSNPELEKRLRSRGILAILPKPVELPVLMEILQSDDPSSAALKAAPAPGPEEGESPGKPPSMEPGTDKPGTGPQAEHAPAEPDADKAEPAGTKSSGGETKTEETPVTGKVETIPPDSRRDNPAAGTSVREHPPQTPAGPETANENTETGTAGETTGIDENAETRIAGETTGASGKYAPASEKQTPRADAPGGTHPLPPPPGKESPTEEPPKPPPAPAAPSVAAPAETPSRAAASPADSAAGKRGRVLVADDDPQFARMLASALEEEGYSVATVPDGAEAFRMAASQHFSVVFMDLMMPGVGGVEAIKLIHERDPGLLIIAVTGKAERETVAEAAKAGAFRVLHKPLDLPRLKQQLSDWSLIATRRKEVTGRYAKSRRPGGGFFSFGGKKRRLVLLILLILFLFGLAVPSIHNAVSNGIATIGDGIRYIKITAEAILRGGGTAEEIGKGD